MDGAHIEFPGAGVKNPLGLKCGPSLDPSDLLRLIEGGSIPRTSRGGSC